MKNIQKSVYVHYVRGLNIPYTLLKKFHITLLLLLIFVACEFTFGICNTYATDTEIKFKESNIYKKVLEELKNKYSLEPRKDDENNIIFMEKENIEKVDELQLNNSNISKIRGIEGFYNLKNLNISNNNITDIGCLAKLNNLTQLTAYGNKISNISALSDLTKIKYLNIAKNKLIDKSNTDNMLNNLSKLTNLIELDISHNYIRYIDGIENLSNLKKLNLYDNNLRIISSIKDLTNLEELNLGQNNELNDHNIKGLANLNYLVNLKYFNFSQNHTPNILGNISNLTNIETLQLEGNDIDSINTNNFTNLKKINLYSNKIQDISKLANLTNLEEIILGKNDIREVTSIIDTSNKIVWPNLKKIDLSGNTFLYQLTDTENILNSTARINNNRKVIKKIYEQNIEINYEYLTDTTNLPHIDENGIRYVTYDDFGAKCDGIYDDFIAIRNAQIYANEVNCEVRGTKGKTYHIFKYYEDAIDVKTNIDWQNANIVIHDEEIENVSGRYKSIFYVNNLEDKTSITNPTWTIGIETKNIKTLIKDQLEELNKKGYKKYFCSAINDEKKQYIRYGGNANQGSNQVDYFTIDSDGNILNDIQWNFDKLASFTLYGIPNAEISIKNGNIISNALNSKSETTHSAGPHKQKYFYRNICIKESANVNIFGIKHTLKKDTVSGSYYGLIMVLEGTNINVDNCELFSRKYIFRSTYDLELTGVINSKYTNISSNSIFDDERWGITGTNYCKDILFDNCELNRIDAHKGIYNLTVKNCTIGWCGITMTGQGELKIENTEITAPRFIPLRYDYGSTWNGNVYIINSTYRYVGTDVPRLFSIYVSTEEDGSLHDFGYECKFPNVYVENLTIDNINNKEYNDVYVIPNSDEKCNILADNYWPDNVYINGYKFINNTLENPCIKLKQTNYGNINTNFVITDCILKLNGSLGQDITDKFDFNKTLITKEDVYFEISPNSSVSNVISIYKDNEKIIENMRIDQFKSFLFNENNRYKIKIESKEVTNNEEGTKLYEFTIDKTAPILTIRKTPEGETDEKVTVTLTSNEEIQGIDGWTLLDDGKTLTKTYTENTVEEITIKDIVGNETTTTITITEIEKKFTSEIYEIEENIIKNIQPNTNKEELINNITSNQEYIIKEGETIVTGTDRIKTGQVLTVGEKSYTLIVTGDTNGDGQANMQDMLVINKHRLNKVQLTGAYLKAGDVNKDDKVDIRDMLQLNKYRLRKIRFINPLQN